MLTYFDIFKTVSFLILTSALVLIIIIGIIIGILLLLKTIREYLKEKNVIITIVSIVIVSIGFLAICSVFSMAVYVGKITGFFIMS